MRLDRKILVPFWRGVLSHVNKHSMKSSAPNKEQLTFHKYGCIAGQVIFGLLQLLPLTTVPLLLNQQSRSEENIPLFYVQLNPFRDLVIAALAFDGLVAFANFLCVAFLLLNNSKNIKIAIAFYMIASTTSFALNTAIAGIYLPSAWYYTVLPGAIFYVGLYLGFAINTFRYARKLEQAKEIDGNVGGARL